jgi:methionyl aminopeptidase
MHHPPNEQVEAGKITAGALILARQLCMNPIIGTRLDQEISTYIQDHGGICALRGYAPPFTDLTYPKTICLSIGFEAVHGLPGPRIVEPDDLITVDLVVEVDGWFTDAALILTYKILSLFVLLSFKKAPT